LMPGKGRVDSVFESYVKGASKLPNQYYLLCITCIHSQAAYLVQN
jgi:hypothetical protein